MIVIKYKVDEHNHVYRKLKKMHKELKDILDCVEEKEESAGGEEFEDEEEYPEAYRRREMYERSSMRGRYGYRMGR